MYSVIQTEENRICGHSSLQSGIVPKTLHTLRFRQSHSIVLIQHFQNQGFMLNQENKNVSKMSSFRVFRVNRNFDDWMLKPRTYISTGWTAYL